MIKLIAYEEKHEKETLTRIAYFFDHHASLIEGSISESNDLETKTILTSWYEKSHELWMIEKNDQIVGFIHLWYKGDTIAWIENLYVDEQNRNQGIATRAIALAEEKVMQHTGYTAICMDVVPRNLPALKLYHKLGYDAISLLTTRKDLYSSKRDQIENILGLDFKI